jgi:ABC-2 type transport system permease protein
MNGLRVFRYAFETGWAELVRDIWLPSWIVRIVSSALFFSLVGQLLESQAQVQFLVIGNIVAAGALATAIAVAISTWDRFDGTYPLLVIAPTTLIWPILGRTACRLVTGIGASLVALLTLGPLFSLPASWPASLLLVPLLTLTSLSSYCFMLFLGAVANYAPNARNLIHNFATICLMGFCGVNVPISFWPEWLQAAAQVLPLTHGLEAIRAVFQGGGASAILPAVLVELAVGAGWFLVAALTMDRMASAGRANASIEFMR